MTRYIALLRGVNVGGNNKIAMPELKSAFERTGFENVETYINSGNVIFSSDLNETSVKAACESLIEKNLGIKTKVAIITAAELRDPLANAPDWWNDSVDSRHNVLFVIAPATVDEVCSAIGEIKPEYEQIASHGKLIFWSVRIATISRTRWSKIVQTKAAYNVITVRNANTAVRLGELSRNER
jgi:uncharacterized protein (DUF1697 family)